MAEIGSGGGGAAFSVDAAEIQKAAVGLAQCAHSVIAGRRCEAILGFGEAQDLVEAVGTFTSTWEGAAVEWNRSLTSYADAVKSVGVALIQEEQARAVAWTGIGGEMP